MAKRSRRPGTRIEDRLVSQLRAEASSLTARLGRISAAIRALVGGSEEGTGRGRPRGRRKGAGRPTRRRRMSAAARKRISDAQKKRWAEQRKKTG